MHYRHRSTGVRAQGPGQSAADPPCPALTETIIGDALDGQKAELIRKLTL